jgi:moderate conductance mechanosensitive channel
MNDFTRTVDDILANIPLERVVQVATVIVIALVVQFVGGRAIHKSVSAITKRARHVRTAQLRGADDRQLAQTLMEDRQRQRATALGSLAKSALTIAVWVIAVLVILSTLGINITPLLASAGVIGAVIGFGAQTYVADYLAGISMIFEDQLGIGDTVELGGTVLGEVEETALRYTRVRDYWGVVWYVRNGTINYVANQSQGWTYSTLEIPVPYEEDLAKVQQVIDATGKEMGEDPTYDGILLGNPTYSAVTEITPTSVIVRVNTKIVPDGNQWYAGRVIRQKMKEALDAAGIRIPYDGLQVRTIQAGASAAPTPPKDAP